jgi:hypothetical protein
MRSRSLLLAALAALALPAVAMAVSSVHSGMSPVVSAKLLGSKEVPKAGAGTGLVVLHLDGGKGTVCWTFTNVAKIDKASAAHIHKGVAGKAGPVVVPLGGAYKAKGCTKAASKLIGTIEEHPSAYYVNVHTAKYPNGAIRGNLAAGMHG